MNATSSSVTARPLTPDGIDAGHSPDQNVWSADRRQIAHSTFARVIPGMLHSPPRGMAASFVSSPRQMDNMPRVPDRQASARAIRHPAENPQLFVLAAGSRVSLALARDTRLS